MKSTPLGDYPVNVFFIHLSARESQLLIGHGRTMAKLRR